MVSITSSTNVIEASGGKMRTRLTVILLGAVVVVVGILFFRQMSMNLGSNRPEWSEHKVRVLTYSTFVGAEGPGPEILDRFKAQNHCDVEVVTVADAGLLLERLKLASASVPFDVVIGLDQLMLADAKAAAKWKALDVDASAWQEIPAQFADESFVPYDWSPLGFIYREGTEPVPQSLDDLLKPEFKGQIALQDPHSSSPGLQFYHWVQAVKKADTVPYLNALKMNEPNISPSWAFSYGLFKKQQVKFVFSYLTSLAYHWGVEKDRQYKIAPFNEGHPVQIEFAGVPEDCRECELGAELVNELLALPSQRAVMEKNFMFPVLRDLQSGTVFAELPELKILKTPLEKDFSDWDQVFKR